QRAAQRDAVGGNGAFTVGLTEVNIQRTIGLLSQRVDVERRTFTLSDPDGSFNVAANLTDVDDTLDPNSTWDGKSLTKEDAGT
ncbi:hypothetical protein KU406_24455, partial [Salmonella enterica subsp. enterica serovar Montevideo]|nr:hypothetical protein [Salmonella enterica subsp. enterica serovar Montevideo]